MTQRIQFQLIIFIVFSLFIIGCNNKELVENDSNIASIDKYVMTTADVSIPSISISSPVSPFPEPTTTQSQINTHITLDEPIEVGDVSVSGTGPANVPIKIYEVANTADLLAETVISKEGYFLVDLNRAVRSTERVGVVVGDLEEFSFKYQDFKNIAIREVPVYGYILADVKVQPK